jgi:hypothetical protein
MAYGVKYRLEFDDLKGNKRKVEIFKNGYSGAVLPMIGTGEPVEIEWKAEEDLYEPLIGSLCTLNLLVTDDVTYDDFYLYDEREYKVVVYFEASAGSWQTYWSGWVVNDLYSQALVSTPYSLSITATDNLGQLDGYDTWMPAIGTDNPTLWQFMYNALSNLSLGYDIYISNDLRIATDSAWKNVFNQVTIKKSGFYHDYYIINDAKMTLRSILIGFNCRLFQSFGRWYIVNCSSYGDQRIIEGIQAGTYTGSGILTAKQAFLNAGTENIKYWIYNASGVEQSTVTTNMLKVVPTNMQPIGQNLFRTPRRPVKKYQEIVDISQQQVDLNLNASFEFDYENWTTTLVTTEFVNAPFAGRRSLKYVGTSALGVYTVRLVSAGSASAIEGNQYQVLFSVNIDKGGSDNRLPWFLRIEYAPGVYTYWSDVNKTWGTSGGSVLWNEAQVVGAGTFESFKFTAKDAPEPGQMQIGFSYPYINSPGNYTGMYLDNCAIRNIDKEQNVYKDAYFIREQSGTFATSDVMEHTDIVQADVDSVLFLGAFTDNNAFKRAQDGTGLYIEQIVTQQRLNDFRQYSMQYEGDLYNMDDYSVMTLAHKLYIKFPTLTETDSAIVDSIRVQLKSNLYTCQFHIPNNYTDVASTYRVSYQE